MTASLQRQIERWTGIVATALVAVIAGGQYALQVLGEAPGTLPWVWAPLLSVTAVGWAFTLFVRRVDRVRIVALLAFLAACFGRAAALAAEGASHGSWRSGLAGAPVWALLGVWGLRVGAQALRDGHSM